MSGLPGDGAGRQRSRFTRVMLYNDPSGLLSFWYSAEWQLQVESEPLPRVRLTPDVRDPDTHMAIAVSDLGAPLAPGEQPAVLEGVREGLAQLDRCEVHSLGEIAVGSLWGVEWRCSFDVADRRCWRRGRLFFSDRYQYAVVFQGSTEERFGYWRGMFEWTMLTVGTGSFDAQRWLADHRLGLESSTGERK
ncbi:MAG: hypothetical protein HPY83_00405 [Anaerolineae bacterium]|nr:hypothetical protein [Anaerolineae bacterium]